MGMSCPQPTHGHVGICTTHLLRPALRRTPLWCSGLGLRHALECPGCSCALPRVPMESSLPGLASPYTGPYSICRLGQPLSYRACPPRVGVVGPAWPPRQVPWGGPWYSLCPMPCTAPSHLHPSCMQSPTLEGDVSFASVADGESTDGASPFPVKVRAPDDRLCLPFPVKAGGP